MRAAVAVATKMAGELGGRSRNARAEADGTMARMSSRSVQVRVLRRGEVHPSEVRTMTAEERVQMMWQLALDAWSFKGEPVVEPRLPRHVVRVQRCRR